MSKIQGTRCLVRLLATRVEDKVMCLEVVHESLYGVFEMVMLVEHGTHSFKGRYVVITCYTIARNEYISSHVKCFLIRMTKICRGHSKMHRKFCDKL